MVAVQLRFEERRGHGEDDFMSGETRLLHAIRRLILYLYNQIVELHAVEVVLELLHL